MNISFLTTRFLLGILFFGQIALGMEKELVQFNSEDKIFYLLLLPLEIQNNIFNYSGNKTNMQHINREWNEKKSIQADDIFTYVQLPEKKLRCIFLSAAYSGNHKGVENILKKLEQTTKCLPAYHMGSWSDGRLVTLNLRGIAVYRNDKKMLELLDRCEIPESSAVCLSLPLIMACLAGNSDCVQELLADVNARAQEVSKDFINKRYLERLLNLVIDFDRVLCFKALYKDQNAYAGIKSLCNKFFNLERACMQKSTKILKELLMLAQNDVEVGRSLNLNRVNTIIGDYDPNAKRYGTLMIERPVIRVTLLDRMLAQARKDPEFNEIAAILQENGAIAVKQEKKEEQLENQSLNEQQGWWSSLSVFNKKMICGSGLIFVGGVLYYKLACEKNEIQYFD